MVCVLQNCLYQLINNERSEKLLITRTMNVQLCLITNDLY